VSPEVTVEWLPALLILGIGLLLGAAVVWRLLVDSRGRAKAAAGIPAMELRDLAGKRDALLAQLRELDENAAKRTPAQLARERYALELEAATTLLAFERGSALLAKAPADPAPAAVVSQKVPPLDRAGMRGFLWGTGSATAVLLLAFFVYQSAKPREAGGSVTGNLPTADGTPSGADATGTAEEAQLKESIARTPNDPELHLALAQLYVERKNWMGIWNETGRVLELSPGNARALAAQSLVRIAMGQTDVAVTVLTKVIADDPGLVDAYAYLSLAYSRMGRMPDAERTIARAAKRFPDRAADLHAYLKDVVNERDIPAAEASASGNPNPHEGLAAPGDDAPRKQAPAVGGVSGTVDVDPSLKDKLPARGVLFVFARAAGAPSEGPPVAVKRLPARFPATFTLTQADSMMGQPLPAELLIEARLDEDGDPTTRPPTDPKARLDGVKVGRSDLRLVLKRP
jgi:tetratricopeptide (TPR) repeat protein